MLYEVITGGCLGRVCQVRSVVKVGCRALALGTPQRYPAARPRRSLPTRTTAMIMIRDRRGRVLLQRRPPTGLWGGLWGFRNNFV